MNNQFPQMNNNNNFKEYTSEDKKTANELCLLSLLCNVVGALLIVLLVAANYNGIIFKLVSMSMGILPTVSLGLVIYVRIKYPKNLFSLILLVIYIIGFIISVIFMIWLCYTCITGCKGM